MLLNKESLDFAQIVLKHFGPSLISKKKESIKEQEEMAPQPKMDTKTKYSLDYEKFEKIVENTPKSEEDMQKVIEQNPFTSQVSINTKSFNISIFIFILNQMMACMHDRRKEREIYEKPSCEKLDNAEYFKNEGNKSFKKNDYEQAAYFYQKALIHFDYTFPDTDEENKRFDLLSEQCHNNMAQCKYIQKDYDDCLQHCHQVLKINQNSIKALFRRARINYDRDQFKECQDDIDRLIKLSDDKDILKLSEQLKQKQKDYIQNTSSVCKRMIDGINN